MGRFASRSPPQVATSPHAAQVRGPPRAESLPPPEGLTEWQSLGRGASRKGSPCQTFPPTGGILLLSSLYGSCPQVLLLEVAEPLAQARSCAPPADTSRGVSAAPQGCEDAHGTVLRGRWDPDRPRCYPLRLGVTFRDRTALPHGAVARGPPSTGVRQEWLRAPPTPAPRELLPPGPPSGVGQSRCRPAPQTASSSSSL